MIHRLVASTTIVAFLTASLPALGEDKEPSSPQTICLPLEAHQKILTDLRELRGDGTPGSGGLRKRVELLDQKLLLTEEQLRDMTMSRDLAVQAKDTAQGALESAERGRREAEESRDAWYRSPALWLATGVVGALVIAITAEKLAH